MMLVYIFSLKIRADLQEAFLLIFYYQILVWLRYWKRHHLLIRVIWLGHLYAVMKKKVVALVLIYGYYYYCCCYHYCCEVVYRSQLNALRLLHQMFLQRYLVSRLIVVFVQNVVAKAVLNCCYY